MTNKFGLDLDAAWERVLNEAWTDDVPDILRWQDHKLVWKDWKPAIEAALDGGTYVPGPAGHVELPKDSLLNRPITLLRPQDRVVYEALVDKLIPAIEGALSDSVYSARVNPKKKGKARMKKQVGEWVRMQNDGRAFYSDYPDAVLLSTDVTSYFEYVDIDILAADLKTLGVDAADVECLQKFLKDLERVTNRWGLPQGPKASSILGNFYLQPLDLAVRRENFRLLRFQDDIKIFGDSAQRLRRMLGEIIRILRARRLSLSVHKTKLLEKSDGIVGEFEDAIKDAISYGLKINAPGAPAELRAYFDEVVSHAQPKARDVKFAITRLADLEDPHAVPWILEHLHEVPYVASQLVDYLSHHMPSIPEIEKRTHDYLSSDEENVYPWTELHLIRMLARAPAVSDESHDCVWRILKDDSKEIHVREHAARCIAAHPRTGDAALLKNMLNYTHDLRLQRALLVAVTITAGIDPAWLGSVASTHAYLRHTCHYLKSGATIPEP